MIKEQFIYCFNFNNDEEKQDAIFYLNVKGIHFYKKIMSYLEFDFTKKNQKIDWSKVSVLLKYDKKLRNKIYIYLATLEEYIRAYISNKYEDNPKQDFWQDGSTKRAKVKTRIENGEALSTVLESIEFGNLINQVKHMPLNDINEMFENNTNIYDNLDAVRELRNAVSHHVFLLGYSFKSCTVNSVESDTLEHNLRNLRELLPNEYRYGKNGNGGITGEIENCKYNFRFNEENKRIKEIMQLELKDIVTII